MKSTYAWYLFIFGFLFMISSMSFLAQGAWETAHDMSNEMDAPMSGWNIANNFNADMATSGGFQVVQISTNDLTTDETGMTHADIVMMFVWMMIIWIPTLLLGYFIPGYGIPIGVIVMSIVMFIFNPMFFPTMIVCCIGSIFILWRGL